MTGSSTPAQSPKNSSAQAANTIAVRYIVKDVPQSVDFYTRHPGFTIGVDARPAFAVVARGPLRLALSGTTGGAGVTRAAGAELLARSERRPQLAGLASYNVSVAAGVTGIGSGRLIPSVAVVVGLIGVVLGRLALARSAGRSGSGNGKRGAIAAGVAGLISVVVGGLHSANSAGGFGTGNGLAGAIVAMVVGVIGMVLCGLALARSRRTG